MNEIKAMLNDFGQRNKNQNAERITDMLANLNAAADGNDVGQVAGMNEEEDDTQTEEWVRRQKAEIKELQKKIEISKKEYK